MRITHFFSRHRNRLLGGAIPVALIFLATGAITSSPTALAPAGDSAITDGVHARLDLSERKLRVMNGGELVHVYDVAVGQPSHPTPTGDFSMSKMIWNPTWVPPDSEWAEDATAKEPNDPGNPMESVKIYFKEPYYYIHGTNDPDSIGEAASHGCVRMTPDDAAAFGEYLMEHAGEPRSDSWYRRVRTAPHTTEIHLDNAVPLSITH